MPRALEMRSSEAVRGSLRFAAEHCQADREIALAAVERSGKFVFLANSVSDKLVLDRTFAMETKKDLHILKTSLVSGRCKCYPLLPKPAFTANAVLHRCCEDFGLEWSGTEVLTYGDQPVPDDAIFLDGPGLQPLGEMKDN